MASSNSSLSRKRSATHRKMPRQVAVTRGDKRDYFTKLYVMIPVTFTGTLDKYVVVNFALFAASSAALRSSRCPLMAFAETTVPSSSIITCTLTGPAAPTAFAAGGYGGCGKLDARPLMTPSDCGGGFRSGALTGGGAVSTALLSGWRDGFDEPGPPGPTGPVSPGLAGRPSVSGRSPISKSPTGLLLYWLRSVEIGGMSVGDSSDR